MEPGVNIPGVNLNESVKGRDGNCQTMDDRACEEAGVTKTKYTGSTWFVLFLNQTASG